MGVSGSGKSTIARLLAGRLGWRLAEGDDFHSAANIAKMRAGVALTDEDRWPWLDAVAAWIRATREQHEHGIVACSALKRAYRERIAEGCIDVRFVYLTADYDAIAERLARRTGHYMPLTLLRSQFDTLEPPGADENPLVMSTERAPAETVDAVIAALGLDGRPPSATPTD
jgi:gluconokinase